MGGWRVREKYPHEGEKERERDRGREQEKDLQRRRARRICMLSLGGGLKGGGGEGRLEGRNTEMAKTFTNETGSKPSTC